MTLTVSPQALPAQPLSSSSAPDVPHKLLRTTAPQTPLQSWEAMQMPVHAAQEAWATRNEGRVGLDLSWLYGRRQTALHRKPKHKKRCCGRSAAMPDVPVGCCPAAQLRICPWQAGPPARSNVQCHCDHQLYLSQEHTRNQLHCPPVLALLLPRRGLIDELSQSPALIGIHEARQPALQATGHAWCCACTSTWRENAIMSSGADPLHKRRNSAS